ncbi:hypothetical protein B0H14DRAFT_3135946 [Mycena olivaceomarginata]|nr:hypothetical protein B0H14DRAFT_3135946 [Mycena olivaceomarginata]
MHFFPEYKCRETEFERWSSTTRFASEKRSYSALVNPWTLEEPKDRKPQPRDKGAAGWPTSLRVYTCSTSLYGSIIPCRHISPFSASATKTNRGQQNDPEPKGDVRTLESTQDREREEGAQKTEVPPPVRAIRTRGHRTRMWGENGPYGSTRYPSYLHAFKGAYTRLTRRTASFSSHARRGSVEGILNVADRDNSGPITLLDPGEKISICLRPTYSLGSIIHYKVGQKWERPSPSARGWLNIHLDKINQSIFWLIGIFLRVSYAPQIRNVETESREN